MKPLNVEILQLLDGQVADTKNFWSSALPLLRLNGLSAWAYSQYANHLPADMREDYAADFKLCALFTDMQTQAAREIESRFPHRLTRIKGAALQNQIYSPGERVFYDIDYLLEPEVLPQVVQALESEGFKKYEILEWDGTRNRTAYTKTLSPHVVLAFDLHTRLMWRQSADVRWRTLNSANEPYSVLTPEDHFFYLTVNWSYQDTFVGLNKFLDLILFWRQNSATLDLRRLKDLIALHRLDRVFQIVFALMAKWGKCDTAGIATTLRPQPDWIVNSPNADFLLAPRDHKLKYVTLKHLVRASFGQALEYDIGWLMARLKNFA